MEQTSIYGKSAFYYGIFIVVYLRKVVLRHSSSETTVVRILWGWVWKSGISPYLVVSWHTSESLSLIVKYKFCSPVFFFSSPLLSSLLLLLVLGFSVLTSASSSRKLSRDLKQHICWIPNSNSTRLLIPGQKSS